jgi:hypothetical protein
VERRLISATCSVVSWAREFSSLSYGHVCTLRVLHVVEPRAHE